MNKIEVSGYIKELSEDLSISSFHHVEHYFPIDRFFIEKYDFLEKIKQVDALAFLFCNLEKVNPTYTVQLMLCLPELWEEMTYEDLLNLIESFTNSFSFYAFIEFTYKYLEIDLLSEIFDNPNVDLKFKKDCIGYFPGIIATFYLDEDDHRAFNENLMGIHINDWNYVKQKLLVSKRIKPALSPKELSNKLEEFKDKLNILN